MTEAPISAAAKQLDELVSRAEAGEEVILTLDGRPAVRLVPVKPLADVAARGAITAEVQKAVAQKIASGEASLYPSAARSQDFLYDEDGLPG
jgi:prevent-host-death family protein